VEFLGAEAVAPQQMETIRAELIKQRRQFRDDQGINLTSGRRMSREFRLQICDLPL
jgi:hypothetical protein